MSESKVTKGPWKVDRDFHLQSKNEYYSIVAGVGYWTGSDQDEPGFNISARMCEADATLIAAAPSMLALLEKITPDDVDQTLYELIQLTILKATTC